jgi:Flp pilus assembly protein TadD
MRRTPRRARNAPSATESPPQPFERQALWVCLALVAINVAIYAPVAAHGFVNWDDPEYVSGNPMVARGLTWPGVVWAFTSAHAANWHPLTWLSHMLDVQLYGMHAGPHHITNVILHVASTVLLFGWLYRATGAIGRSVVVAALFAAHPLHVESVAWVAERKDVLSTVFWMLALWAYTAYVRRPSLGRYAAVFASIAFGLMAKPMLVTLPIVLLLVDVWPLRRVELVGFDRKERTVWLRLALEKFPLLVLALASAVVTFAAQSQGGAVARLEAFPLRLRMGNALLSYVAYMKAMLWPVQMAVVYPPRTTPAAWTLAAAATALVAVSVVAVHEANRRPYLLVGWLWYLGTLVPVIGLVQVGSQPMADRYTYVPLVGLFIILAWGVPDILAGWRASRVAMPAAAGLAIAACAVVARAQVRHWRDDVALWTHALDVTSPNPRAHNNLANAFDDRRLYADAIAHYREAIRLKPDFAEAHGNLANALTHEGRLDEAGLEYTAALRLNPNDAFAHNGLGSTLDEQGKVAEATAHYMEALRIAPDLAEARNNLGISLANQGRVDDAIREFLEAIRVKPTQADFHYNLAVMYGRKGNTAEARQHFEKALAIDPKYEAARQGLGALAPRD